MEPVFHTRTVFTRGRVTLNSYSKDSAQDKWTCYFAMTGTIWLKQLKEVVYFIFHFKILLILQITFINPLNPTGDYMYHLL
jgi:hypothetical protein